MKKNRFFMCAGFFLALSLAGQAQVWEEQLSYEGRFRILAPAPLTEKVDSVDTHIGSLAIHTFFYQAPETDENAFYMVQYYDYPEGTIHSDSTDFLEEFFGNTVEEAVLAVKGELRYMREDILDGFPGKLWRIDYLDEQVVIKTRAWLVRNRYYAVQAIMTRDQSLNRSAERFLDSFSFLK